VVSLHSRNSIGTLFGDLLRLLREACRGVGIGIDSIHAKSDELADQRRSEEHIIIGGTVYTPICNEICVWGNSHSQSSHCAPHSGFARCLALLAVIPFAPNAR
jgi:hypothetical protein